MKAHNTSYLFMRLRTRDIKNTRKEQKLFWKKMLHADHNNNKTMYATCVCDLKYLSITNRIEDIVSFLGFLVVVFFCHFPRMMNIIIIILCAISRFMLKQFLCFVS